MKKIIFYPLSLLTLITAVFSSCDKEEVTFSGNDYVLFSDTLAYMPVTEDENRTFDVEIAATKVSNVDRNYAVEMVVNKTNAIEGHHFDLVSNNLTIKAGELSGKVKVKGYYDNIVYGEKLEFTLRLLAPKNEKWDLYGDESRVSLIKCPKFDINKFAGNLRMYAAFPFSNKMINFLIKSEVINDSTLLLKAPFDPRIDLKVRFHNNANNPFENRITVYEQEVFPDLSNGMVFVKTVDIKPSNYITEARTFALYLDVFVPKLGSFGVHQYIYRWVSQSEVDAESNDTGTPFTLERALNPTL